MHLKTCPICKEQFATKKRKQRFCSLQCAGRDKSKPKIILVCKYCNKNFYEFPAYATSRKFCSKSCYTASMTGSKNRNWTGRKLRRICPICKKKFLVRRIDAKYKRGKFCSTKCMGEGRKGENHPSWKGGISFEPYCIKFNNEFKERVRNFFGRQCIECQKTEEENKRKLDVHHVNYDKMVCCNEIKPLFVALCRSHNVMANNNRNYWQEHFTRIINEKYEGKCYIEKGDENQCPHTPSTRT